MKKQIRHSKKFKIVCSVIALFLVGCISLYCLNTPFTQIGDDTLPLASGIKTVSAEYYLNTTGNNSIYMLSYLRYQKIGTGTVVNPKQVYHSPSSVSDFVDYVPKYQAEKYAGKTIEWESCVYSFGKWRVIGTLVEAPAVVPTSSPAPATPTPVPVQPVTDKSTVSPLYVNGTSFFDSNNSPVILRGLSCASSTRITKNWSTWYNDTSINEITDWGVNVFRITLKPDQFIANPDLVKTLEQYIDLCIKHKLYVVVSWMVNENPNNCIDEASNFFEQLAAYYGTTANVMYEICNEPFNTSWDEIAKYSNTIIPLIRSYNKDAVVLVSVPYTLSSNDDTMLSIIGNELDYSNIMYCFHLYVGSSLQSTNLKNIEALLNANIPVFITEWGTTRSNGSDGFYETNSNIFVKFMETHNMNWINFQLSDVYWDNVPCDSSMVKMGEWNNSLSDSILSESGYYIKHLFLGDNISYNNYRSQTVASVNNSLSNSLTSTSNGLLSSSNSNVTTSDSISCIMMDYTANYAFWEESIRKNVTEIYFETNNYIPNDYLDSWDMSLDFNSKSVVAYTVDDKNGGYILYIVAANDSVVAPASMSKYFDSFAKLQTISFNNLDTSQTTKMNNLCYNCPSLTSIDCSTLDTAKVTTFSMAFASCTKLTDLDISNLDFSSATNINMMFSWCSRLIDLKLPKLYSANITSSTNSLYKLGYAAKSKSIISYSSSDDTSFLNNQIDACNLSNVSIQLP